MTQKCDFFRFAGDRRRVTAHPSARRTMSTFATATAALFTTTATLLSRPPVLFTRTVLSTSTPRCSPPVLRAGDTNLWSVPWSALTHVDPIAIVEAQLASLQDGNVASCYHLASPGFRRAAGSIQKFEQVVRENPEYVAATSHPCSAMQRYALHIHTVLRSTHAPRRLSGRRPLHLPHPPPTSTHHTPTRPPAACAGTSPSSSARALAGRKGCPPSYLGATAPQSARPVRYPRVS
jgi:hypothetical protein